MMSRLVQAESRAPFVYLAAPAVDPSLSMRRIWKAGDGSAVLVRPIEPGDFERERRFVDGLSPQTRYQRLLSPRRPSDDELRRWTRVDPAREGALVATVSSAGEERQIGVARYAMEDEGDAADVAIVISDDWHGMGLGKQLLSALLDLARRSGVRRVVGTTLSENKAMLALARRLGFKLSRERGSGFVTMISLALLPET